MRTLGLILSAFLFSGCAGTMLDGTICTIATDTEVQKDIKVIVDEFAPKNEQEKKDLYLKLAKFSATAVCEQARAIRAAKLAKAEQK